MTIDETTGSVTLRAVVPNPNDILWPGLFVRATLDLGAKEALLVPQRAATRTPEGLLSVWVVDGKNKATPKTFETSGAHKDSWIVSSGLTPGDTIIVTGYQKIGPGAPVAPSPWLIPGTETKTVLQQPDASPSVQKQEQE